MRQPKEPTPEPVDEVDVEREEEEVEPLAAGKQEEEVEEEKEEAAPVMEEEPDKDEPDSGKATPDRQCNFTSSHISFCRYFRGYAHR